MFWSLALVGDHNIAVAACLVVASPDPDSRYVVGVARAAGQDSTGKIRRLRLGFAIGTRHTGKPTCVGGTTATPITFSASSASTIEASTATAANSGSISTEVDRSPNARWGPAPSTTSRTLGSPHSSRSVATTPIAAL